MRRVRPALAVLVREIGAHHGLASRKLYTDGAPVPDFGRMRHCAGTFSF